MRGGEKDVGFERGAEREGKVGGTPRWKAGGLTWLD